MATAKKVKKVSRASLMRQYYNGNPEATVNEAAKKFKTSYQIAYMVRREMQKKKKTLKINDGRKLQGAKDWRLVALSTSGKSILNPEITVEEPQSVLDTINPECVKSDPVNHPAHYKVGGIETIDFIEAKSLGYHLGNAVKYITRADHKGNRLQDLQKAKWYIDRAIEKAGA
jgi:hypothetical protein